MMAKAAKYSYASTRIGSLKTRLLDRGLVNRLLKAPSPSEIIRLLEETCYGKELDELSLKHTGANLIELALGKNLAAEFKNIAYWVPSNPKPVVSLLSKWDVHNLKAILLGKFLGYPKEDILHLLVAAGDLNWTELNAILDRESVEDVVGFLGKYQYGRVLAEKIGEYTSGGHITPLLAALDSQYYKTLAGILMDSTTGPKIKSLIKTEIDVKNIMLVIRAKKEDVEDSTVSQHVIAGGHLSAQTIGGLFSAKDVEEVVAKIKDAYDLSDELDSYELDNSIAHFEKALEKKLARERLTKMKYSVMSLETIFNYVYTKEEEVNNIRKITRAKEFAVPGEEIEESLVFSDARNNAA